MAAIDWRRDHGAPASAAGPVTIRQAWPGGPP